jgi:hypothetical protein
MFLSVVGSMAMCKEVVGFCASLKKVHLNSGGVALAFDSIGADRNSP